MRSRLSLENRPVFDKILMVESSDLSISDLIEGTDDIQNFEAEGAGYDFELEGNRLQSLIDPERVSEFIYNITYDIAAFEFSFKWDQELSVMSEEDPTLKMNEVTKNLTVNIFIHKSGYTFLQGRRMAINKAEKVARWILDDIVLSEVVFESAFFLWLIYKVQNADEISGNLSLQRLVSVELAGSGAPDKYSLKGEEPLDQHQSPRFFNSLYNHHDIDRIEGEFEIYGYDISADIRQFEGICTIPSKGSLSNASEAKRLVLSLLFCYEFTDTYLDWLNKDSEERVPPPGFYRDLQEKVENSETLNFTGELNYPFEDRFKGEEELLANSEAEVLEKDISDILSEGESETIEFKEELPDHRNNIAKEVVALTNYKGGVMVFGVNNSSEVVGLDDIHADEETISNILSNNVQPPIEYGVEFESVEGEDILLLRIPQYRDVPHAADYTFYIRRGTTKRGLNPYNLRYLMPDSRKN